MAMTTPDVRNIFSLTTKRLTDIVLEQSREAFRRSGVKLDAKMISIVTLLHQQGPLTSTALSERTGLSRQLVESRLGRLAKDGYLEEGKDPEDLRRRIYAIARDKETDVSLAIRTVASFEEVYESLWTELGFDLQQDLRAELGQRDSVRAELERGERKIADLQRELGRTRAELRSRNRDLQALRQRAAVQRQDLARNRDRLVTLVRAHYMSGRHEPLKLLLNQRDPAAVGRMFTYYEYIADARRARLARITADIDALARSETEVVAAQRELQGLAAAQSERRDRLQAERKKRHALLAKLDAQIAGDDEKLRRLRADAEHLRTLLQRLQRELADIARAPGTPGAGTDQGALRPTPFGTRHVLARIVF